MTLISRLTAAFAVLLALLALPAAAEAQDTTRRFDWTGEWQLQSLIDWQQIQRGLFVNQQCTADGTTMADRLFSPVPTCFDLWAGCDPVRSVVRVDKNEIGLQEDDIENAVESRLRATGVYGPGGSGQLAVRVQFLDDTNTYLISIAFQKGALIDQFGFQGFISTWESVVFGVHGRDAGFMMESIRGKLDEFTNHYLRVNEPACSRR